MSNNPRNGKIAGIDAAPQRAVFTPLTAPGEPERRERNRVDFGHDVKLWRMGIAMTQMQASIALGINIQTIRNWEQGLHIPLPGVRVVIRLAMSAIWHNLDEWGKGATRGATTHPILERVELKRAHSSKWLDKFLIA